MLPNFSFVVFICFYLAESKSFFKAIRNKNFDNKLLQNQIASNYATSKISCIQFCAYDPNCLSFNYNKGSSTCVLFDQDFTDVVKTVATTEDGWLYYYLIKDYNKSLRYRCTSTIPTSDICSMFCLHYFYDTSASYAVHATKCSGLDGGEMVSIDRGLKQHCVGNLLGNPLVGITKQFAFIQATKNFNTGEWEFDDGTKITSIPWGPSQPNDPAAEHLVLETNDFSWWDVPPSWNKPGGVAVVCQQI